MKLETAIEHFGTKTNISRALGITRSAINRWRHDGIPIPRQYQIEVITNGKLKAER